MSINSAVNHVDEWYIADLTEQGSDMTTLLSLGLAALSFILTLLILPSFWTDLKVVEMSPELKSLINSAGTSFAVLLMIIGAGLTFLSIQYGKQIIKIMRRSLMRLKRTIKKQT